MPHNKKGVGTFITELISIFFIIILVIFFYILFNITVSERVYEIKSNYESNSLTFQAFSFLRGPYEGSDIAEKIILDCKNNGNFQDLIDYTKNVPISKKLGIDIMCKENKVNIMGEGCDRDDKSFNLVSLDERDFIRIIYCGLK